MTAPPKTFVGFGFGAIQAGLFLYEAFRSGNFGRLVVAEVVPEIVDAVRRAQGRYRLNIATNTGIQVHEIQGVEILNPTIAETRQTLLSALADASEIATALPSVEFFDRGKPTVASLLAEAHRRKQAHAELPSCVVYTAENHNHAAEILEKLYGEERRSFSRMQFLNTVIGKMSGVVTDKAQIAKEGLACLTDDLPRAILVEEFNRILITQISIPNFKRGIKVFVEKPDLLPFEEAKLYGHNAVHALLGYLAQRKGYRYMSDAANDKALMTLAREAFLHESGPALIARHKGVDPLFTPEGYRVCTEDLLARMVNPFLRDQTERVTRDTPRKLGWDDRLIGTMRLALDAGVTPWRFAIGAAAALEALRVEPLNRMPGSAGIPAGEDDACKHAGKDAGAPRLSEGGPTGASQLQNLWPVPDQPPGRKAQLIQLITEAQAKLKLEKI